MTAYAALRRTMVDNQIRTFDVTDRAVLAAMEEVPRELHVPPGQEALAYLDRNIPIPGPADDSRVVLAPMVLARMIQALEVGASERVLDVASGYGYAAAVLARLGAEVVALEERDDLAPAPGAEMGPVRRVSAALGAAGSLEGPFGAILVNGAVGGRPDALLGLLGDGGRLVGLQADGQTCRAMLYVKTGEAIGFRALFDATAPVLKAFRQAPAFVF